MSQDQLRDQIATVVAVCHGFEQPGAFEHEVASRIWAKVVAPLLADLEIKLAAAQLDILERGKEIDRLRREVEFEANGERFNHGWTDLSLRPCACLTSEGAALVAADPRWSLPQCVVHPDRGGQP